MLAHSGGSVEAPSGRRRGADISTGLDYSTSYRVEADIPTQIRSLLLSHQAYCPPRTPRPSDETASRYQHDFVNAESFDFNTAKSVAESARLNSDRLGLPPNLASILPYGSEMLPESEHIKRPAPRWINTLQKPHAINRSFDGVDATVPDPALDGTMIRQTLSKCGILDSRQEESSHTGFSARASNPDISIPCKDGPMGTSSVINSQGPETEDALGGTVHLIPRHERPIRHIASNSTLRFRDCPPLPEAIISKGSTHRHALLKPSVAALQSSDLGRSIQPFLVNAADMSPTLATSKICYKAGSGHDQVHSLAPPVAALTGVLEMTQSKETACDEQFMTPDQTRLANSTASPRLHSVKLGVEVATQNAVGPVLHKAGSSTAGELKNIPNARTSLTPDPLAEAALRAEEYLRRDTSWGNESTTKRQARIGSVGEHSSKISSVSSAGQLNTPPKIASEHIASFKDLNAQESLESQTAIPEKEATDLGLRDSNWATASVKRSPQKSPFEYSKIPSRKSSLDKRAPVPGTSFENIPCGKNFLEQPACQTGRSARSISSISSGKINKIAPPSYQLPSKQMRKGASAETYNNHLGVHLLPEEVSEPEIYTPRLTAIPPRKHRLPKVSSKSKRRFAASSDALMRRSDPRASQTFLKTINDLENLMSEAIHIARQAAQREDVKQAPCLLPDAATIHNIVKQRVFNRGRLRSNLRSQLSETLSNKGSVHESVPSISSDASSQDDDYAFEKGNFKTTSNFAHLSDGKIVMRQTATLSEAQSTRPLNWTSSPHTVPVLAGPKAAPTGILHRSIPVSASDQGSVIKSKSMMATAAGAPKIRDGNTKLSLQSKTEKESEIPFTEDRMDEQSRDTRLKQNTTLEKKAVPVLQPYDDDYPIIIKATRPSQAVMNKREVAEFIRAFHQPPIQSRHSSLALRKTAEPVTHPMSFTSAIDTESNGLRRGLSSQTSIRNSSTHTVNIPKGRVSEDDFSTPEGFRIHTGSAQQVVADSHAEDADEGAEGLPKRHISGRLLQDRFIHLKHDKFSHLSLRGKSHVSLREHNGFSLSRSHRRQPMARDWSTARKRFTASITCISTALIGVLIGIYAGEVPSIQYYIADFYHYSILGNVFFLIALSATTLLFWPLPLLHGRKPYTLAALTLALPLLFPQAVSVSMQRSPYVATWRVLLLLPRTLMGAALGFANMNFMATLTDLFGASLQSGNPHQETINEFDVRRHGGGLGVWLGIWTWCYIGSIGVGFLIGALIIDSLSPDWGFYVSVVLIAAVLLLNVVTPEVRRSTYRRSVTEVRSSKDISRRLARGEVMMHRIQTGPKWWGQEFHQGIMLSLDMLRQPGFLIMSLYVAWIYGQIVLVIVLLGSLMSKYYRFTSPAVGATTMAIPLGALLAVPFQKASLFSRARHHPQRTDSMTFDTKVTFSSHLVRRAIFTLVLPFAALAYTLSSAGPPTPFILPVLFAGLIGFLSSLAIAECNGIIMETFDTSDLQPGMTGRPRGASGERTKYKRTNYSSFPRVSSAFAIIQALGFLMGAAATGIGGVAERRIGQQAATGVMAGILLIQTFGVLGILYRFKEVQIIPSHTEAEMEKWERERKMNIQRQREDPQHRAPDAPTPELDEPWRPVIIGNPSGKTRRMSILELGHLSRWSEIRRKNRLVDEMSCEARHPNLATLEDVRNEIRDKNFGSLHRGSSRRSQQSRGSPLNQESDEPEPDVEANLGKSKLDSSALKS